MNPMTNEIFDEKNFKLEDEITVILMTGKLSHGYYMGKSKDYNSSFLFRNKGKDDLHELNISLLASAKKGWN